MWITKDAALIREIYERKKKNYERKFRDSFSIMSYIQLSFFT